MVDEFARREPDEVIELTFQERALFGVCPICSAAHGEPCVRYEGIHLGFTVTGELPDGGVHMMRVNAAPSKKYVYYGEHVRLGSHPTIQQRQKRRERKTPFHENRPIAEVKSGTQSVE